MIVHVLSCTVHFTAEALGRQLQILVTAICVLSVDNALKLTDAKKNDWNRLQPLAV